VLAAVLFLYEISMTMVTNIVQGEWTRLQTKLQDNTNGHGYRHNYRIIQMDRVTDKITG